MIDGLMQKAAPRLFGARQAAFVLSLPRSGSTWLKEALRAHPEIHCTEFRLFGRHFDVVRDDGKAAPRVRITLDEYVRSLIAPLETTGLADCEQELEEAVLARLAGELFELAHARSGKRIVIDKITPYPGTALPVAGCLTRYFPRAKIIHLVRDGRDVAVSSAFHWLNKRVEDAAESEASRRRRAFYVHNTAAAVPPRFFSAEELQSLAAQWNDLHQAVCKLASSQQVVRVRYEDMIADQPAELRRLFGFLGASASRRVAEHCAQAACFERMSGGRKRGEALPTAHVRKGIAGEWREYFTREIGRAHV